MAMSINGRANTRVRKRVVSLGSIKNVVRAIIFSVPLALLGCGGGGDASSGAAKSVTDISSSGSSKTDIENFTNYINSGTLPAAPDCASVGNDPQCKWRSISGAVYGLAKGQKVTLLNKGVNALTVSVDGSFKLPNVIADGGSYEITVGQPPLNQSCVVVGGSGAGVHADVAGVVVACTTYPNCASVSAQTCSLFRGMKTGINVTNIYPAGAYDKIRLTDELVADICNRFDTVRLMFKFFDPSTGVVDNALVVASRKAAEKFVACGASVIINHAGLPSEAGWTDATPPEPRLNQLWTQIGQAYQGAHKKIFFELLNEPGVTPRLNDAMQGMLAALRATGVQNVAILSPAGASEAGYLGGVRLPADQNIIYTIHQYVPFDFTHQGVWWSKYAFPTGATCCDATQTNNIDMVLKRAYEWTLDKGYPIVIGEFGSLYCGDESSRKNYMTANISRARKWDMPFVLWAYDDAFGLFERNAMRWDPVLLPLIQKPSAGDPPSGFLGYPGIKKNCR